MADEPTVKAHSLLDKINSPEVVGVVPGSLRVREDVRRIDARLQTGQQFNFDASSLDLQGALVGSKCDLIVVARAKKSDGTNVLNTDPISLREEASNIIWRDITLLINGQEVSHNVRADVVRHMMDRFHQNSREFERSHTAYRQLNKDDELTSPAGTPEQSIFKEEMIRDDGRFELIRPLDDLPFFAEGDSLIPGFNTIQIRALTTSEPQTLFKTNNTITSSPYLLVEEVKLRYTTVKLDPAIAQELQSMAAGGELEMNGSLWSAVNLTPRIDAGARRWTQGVATAFGTVPDITYFVAFPESTFIPPANAYSQSQHPLLHTWAAMSDIEFTSGSGEEIRHYRDAEGVGGKVKIIHEARKSVADQGGMNNGTGSLADPCAVDPTTFVLEPGVGSVPLYMRNWAETDTHKIKPMTMRIRADLNDPGFTGAPENAQPYIISKSRHRWVISPTPGATKIIV
jgi:hypothetical protein